MLKSNNFPRVLFLLFLKNDSLLMASSLWPEQKWSISKKTWKFNYIQHYLIAGTLQSLWPFCSLPFKCRESWSPRRLKKIHRYLFTFKLLSFEWVAYEKNIPIILVPFFKENHSTRQNSQHSWQHVPTVWIYCWDKTEACKYPFSEGHWS